MNFSQLIAEKLVFVIVSGLGFLEVEIPSRWRSSMVKRAVSVAILLTFVAAAPAFSQLQLVPTEAREVFSYGSSDLYPEGVDQDALTGRTFVSSVLHGDISVISSDGTVSTFEKDPRLISTIGVRVDEERRRLVVVNSDYGVARKSSPSTDRQIGAIVIFNLDTGELISYVDIAPLEPNSPLFLNDLDIDQAGNIYATNSLSPTVFKVDAAGNASVFLRNDRFLGAGFNLNGVRVHPGGYLLVGKKSDGALFKVPLSAPDRWSEVRLPEAMIGTDGILLSGNDLLLIRNRTATTVANEIVLLRSEDGWSSARVVMRQELPDNYATTATIRDGAVWVSEGWLHTLKPGGEAPQRSFSLRRVATVEEPN